MPATVESVPAALTAEFDRQLDALAARGFAGRAGITPDAFRRALAPLRARAAVVPDATPSPGRVPFVLVPAAHLVPPAELITMAELRGKPGFTTVGPDDLLRFAPVEGVEVPEGLAYLLTGVDSGRATLNVTPDDAAPVIAGEGRSPLTLQEGLALVLHHPAILREGNAFSMLGSRCGDRRVTAVWVSGGRPRLGWCWAGNPHTWLGSASCAARISL